MSYFRRFFLAAGLPFGLLLGIGTSNFPFFAWYDLLLTSLICTTAFAGALAIVAWAFTRFVRPSVVAKVFLFVALEATALVGGMTLFQYNRELPHGRWIRVIEPPEPAIALSGPLCGAPYPRDSNSVVITTAAGHRFGLRKAVRSPDRWVLVPGQTDSIAAMRFPCRNGPVATYATPIKPKGVLSEYQVVEDHVECIWHDHYVITVDRRIWAWGDGGCALPSVFAWFTMVAVVAILAIIGFRIALSQWPLGPRPQAA